MLSFFLAAPLGYFVFNCGIFIKLLSINQTLQSLKIIIWYNKIIIWYKKLSFDINICSHLIGPFQNFLEEIFTHNF